MRDLNQMLSKNLFFCILFLALLLIPPTCEAIAESSQDQSMPGERTEKSSFDPESELKRLNDMIEKGIKNAVIFYNRGWIHEYKGDLDGAKEDYGRAIEIDGRYADAYYNRGLLYLRAEKYEEAVEDFSNTISLKPESVDAYCNRGNAYFRLGKTDLALKDYDSALKLDPEDPDLYYNRALIYLQKGEKPKALANLQIAARSGHKLAKKYLKRLNPTKKR
jgi:tetratricopeptide (TPR) repeat protein